MSVVDFGLNRLVYVTEVRSDRNCGYGSLRVSVTVVARKG